MEIYVMYYPHFTNKSNSDSEVKTQVPGHKPQSNENGKSTRLDS